MACCDADEPCKSGLAFCSAAPQSSQSQGVCIPDANADQKQSPRHEGSMAAFVADGPCSSDTATQGSKCMASLCNKEVDIVLDLMQVMRFNTSLPLCRNNLLCIQRPSAAKSGQAADFSAQTNQVWSTRPSKSDAVLPCIPPIGLY